MENHCAAVTKCAQSCKAMLHQVKACYKLSVASLAMCDIQGDLTKTIRLTNHYQDYLVQGLCLTEDKAACSELEEAAAEDDIFMLDLRFMLETLQTAHQHITGCQTLLCTLEGTTSDGDTLNATLMSKFSLKYEQATTTLTGVEDENLKTLFDDITPRYYALCKHIQQDQRKAEK